LEAPEKFYRISDTTRARFQNAGFLADFALATENMLSKFYYLGPLRDHPRRTYQWSGDTPDDVGQRGEFTVAAILAAEAQGRKLNRAPRQRLSSFTPFVAGWLKDLGVIHSFDVKAVAEGRKEFEVLLRAGIGAPEVKITDVGFGISQVLPALVLPFYCPPNSVVWMEQPEIHLHPQVQAELADVFICAAQAREDEAPRNVQLIVESHSEHFLNRLQRRIAEGAIKPEEVAIYFCKKNGTGGAELEPLRLNAFGDIENWPENFFGDEMADLTARTVAAAKRRRQTAAK
jgi:predicted ATPase